MIYALLLAIGSGPIIPPQEWTPIAALEPKDPDLWVTGRVVDAETSAPLADVLVEAFREDYFEALDPEPLQPVWTQRTDVDGTYRFARFEGLEKMRFTAPGRAPTTMSASEANRERVPLFPERAFRFRVTDLEGQPLPGAFALTHQTCSHTPPAAKGLGNGEGWIEMSIPPMSGHADIEIGAPGYGRALDDSDWLRWLALRDGSVDVMLPRRLPIEMTVLSSEGMPLVGRIVQEGPPYAEAPIDPLGRVRFTSPSAHRSYPLMGWLQSAGTELDYVASLAMPRGHALTLRPETEDWDVEDHAGETAAIELLLIERETPDGRDAPRPWIVTRDGVAAVRGAGRHVLPIGPALVLGGGAFSGWQEQVHDVVIGRDERIVLDVQPEPRVELIVPPGKYGIVDLQVGPDAIRVERRHLDDGVFVPPGERIVAVYQHLGEVRRIVHAGTEVDLELDLTDPETVVRKKLDWENEKTNVVQLTTPNDEPLRFREFTFGRSEVERTEEGAAYFRAPVRSPFEVEAYAEGFASTWILGNAGRIGGSFEARPVALATVSIEGPVSALFIGAHAADGAAAARGVQLNPGPSIARVFLIDGRAFECSLDLSPGEHRALHVD